MFKDINDNPISNAWKNRYAAQSDETKRKLDELKKADPKQYQLKVIKRTRNEPSEGDIFVLSPRENIYFYGRVLKSNINHIWKDTFVHGKNVIVVFKAKNTEISMDRYSPDYDNLLIKPAIVDKSYWSKGFFFTIGNNPVESLERNLDIGFYSIHKKEFLKETGVTINHLPSIFGTYGITTIIGIAYEIEKELIINPSILEF